MNSQFPQGELGVARDLDMGELARPSLKHLAPMPLTDAQKALMLGFATLAAALATVAVLL